MGVLVAYQSILHFLFVYNSFVMNYYFSFHCFVFNVYTIYSILSISWYNCGMYTQRTSGECTRSQPLYLRFLSFIHVQYQFFSPRVDGPIWSKENSSDHRNSIDHWLGGDCNGNKYRNDLCGTLAHGPWFGVGWCTGPCLHIRSYTATFTWNVGGDGSCLH